MAHPSQPVIESLVARCRNGDRAAQRELYRRYAKAMLNVANRILNSPEEAEDALQEAFLKAFTRLDRYRGDATFGAWLKRIVVNQSINLLKRRRLPTTPWQDHLDETLTDDEGGWEPEPAYTAADALRALQDLPPGYRTVFTLYLLEGYDHKEIAEILGISISTSISQYNRAKRKLKTLLESNKYGSDRTTISGTSRAS